MQYDVIVAGSGSAGMTTAVVAAQCGLKVLLVEKTPYFGGTTALSGGGCWVPNNHQMSGIGASDSPEAAMQYLEAVVGGWLRRDLATAFLANGPEMVDFMLAHTAVQMTVRPGPDYFPDQAGAALGGRAFTPVLFDGRILGKAISALRPPLPQFNAPWGMMVNMADLQHAMAVGKSLKSSLHVLKLLTRFAFDKILYGRGMRLTMGNALAARLLKSALDAGVTLWTDSPIVELIQQDRAVIGAVVKRCSANIEVRAARGVVLATGGFSANPQMRKQYYPAADQALTLVPAGNTGDGLSLAVAAGAAMVDNNADNGVWVVMSRYLQSDGTTLPIPHILDFGRPGAIIVTREGCRFANEATLFVAQKMLAAGLRSTWAICDAKFIHKYGLGLVLPRALRLRRLVRSGYLTQAPTLSALAQSIGVDPGTLEKTVHEANAAARAGYGDPAGKGDGGFDRYLGDPSNKPNPNLGTIDTGPFYALEIYPGDVTSTLGLQVSARGEVLDATGAAIDGLYACGLDMNSIWAGRAPANGANNGANMTFGYIIARHLTSASLRTGTRATIHGS